MDKTILFGNAIFLLGLRLDLFLQAQEQMGDFLI